jgi:hypothetical protein
MPTAGKQQFNVALPAELIRRVKHRSIDVQLSLSDFVAGILPDHLSAMESPMTQSSHAESGTPDAAPSAPPVSEGGLTSGLDLQPMVHVKDMAAAVDFYEHLAAETATGCS